jgi:hypothetical protein
MKVCIFGAGKRGIQIKRTLQVQNITIQGFIDNYYVGEKDSVNVYSLEHAIKLWGKDIFIIVSMSDKTIWHEICNQLDKVGMQKGKNYVIWQEIFEEQDLNDFGIMKHPLGMSKIYDLYHELELMYKKYVFKDMELAEDPLSYKLLYNLIGTGNSEAIYIRYYLKKCLQLEGDVCEFGIAQGTTSAMLANDIKNSNKHLWLFDSFEGLSIPTEKDILKNDIFHLGSMDKYAYSMKCSIEEVKERLKEIDIDETRIKIIPGFIEKTVLEEEVKKNLNSVSFAYIDFDLYDPILTALKFLHKRTKKGSVIIVDDYDFFSTGAKTAVDEFVHDNRDYYELCLPNDCAGHFCIIIKTK